MPILLTLLFTVPLAPPAEAKNAPPAHSDTAATAIENTAVDERPDEVLADPWSEDIEIELAEIAAACGIGVCTTLFNLPLTLLTLGVWSGIVIPAGIGLLITSLNNASTRWHATAVWPVVAAVLVGGAWTMVTLLGWAFFGSWFLAASDPNFALGIFPPNSSNYAQALLPAVNVSLIVMSALGPAVATMGAIGGYNVTAELQPSEDGDAAPDHGDVQHENVSFDDADAPTAPALAEISMPDNVRQPSHTGFVPQRY